METKIYVGWEFENGSSTVIPVEVPTEIIEAFKSFSHDGRSRLLADILRQAIDPARLGYWTVEAS